jgi:hypothetical protein
LTPCHFGLSPPCGFLRPFCIGAAEEGGNRQGKKSVKVADGYRLRVHERPSRVRSDMARSAGARALAFAVFPHGVTICASSRPWRRIILVPRPPRRAIQRRWRDDNTLTMTNLRTCSRSCI